MTRTPAPPAVRLDTVTKAYGPMKALDGVSWAFPRGGFTAVMGPSGSGKSTFLHCASGLDRPTAGAVWIGDTELGRLREAALTRLRRERVGFVFQSFNLIPSMDVEENVALPLRLGGRQVDRDRIASVLARVGLADRMRHRPSELSGGQQQRVALARALVTDPEVVFADEPTGALDPRTAREMLRLMREAVDVAGQTVVLVTHDPVAASWADSVLFLDGGRIVEELASPTVASVLARWDGVPA
ncbi:ABC transporter ATP-binding protein [Spirillospora sp. NPDC049652]